MAWTTHATTKTSEFEMCIAVERTFCLPLVVSVMCLLCVLLLGALESEGKVLFIQRKICSLGRHQFSQKMSRVLISVALV